MHIHVKQQPDGGLLRIDGDFLSEPDQERFRARVNEMIRRGEKHIVVDLSGVPHINSCALGSLVCGLVITKKAGGSLVVINAGERVRQLFRMTKLDSVFLASPGTASTVPIRNATHN